MPLPTARLPSLPDRPHWGWIEIDGHPCELFDPPDPLPGRAVIYLHGVRERTLRESVGLRTAVEQARLRAVAPRAGRSWWLDRIVSDFDSTISPERFVVERVTAALGRRFAIAPPGIALVGTSMGGQGVLRIAYRHPAIFPIAAAIAPALDFHLAMRDVATLADGDLFASLWPLFGEIERARQETAILHVHPLNWPRHQWFASDPTDRQWHDGACRLREKLTALGIPHVAILDRIAGGHGTAYYDSVAADAIAFVRAALDAESRRLV